MSPTVGPLLWMDERTPWNDDFSVDTNKFQPWFLRCEFWISQGYETLESLDHLRKPMMIPYIYQETMVSTIVS